MKFLTPERCRKVNLEAIVSLVEEAYHYPPGTLRNRSQCAEFAHPRHLCAYLMTELGGRIMLSGAALSRHHTTIVHGRKVIAEHMKSDAQVRTLVESLLSTIRADPNRFAMRIRSVIQKTAAPAKPRKTKERPLPDQATKSIRGLEEIDDLILSGQGDKPRLAVSQLNRKPH
jgi:hypothetical protein